MKLQGVAHGFQKFEFFSASERSFWALQDVHWYLLSAKHPFLCTQVDPKSSVPSVSVEF